MEAFPVIPLHSPPSHELQGGVFPLPSTHPFSMNYKQKFSSLPPLKIFADFVIIYIVFLSHPNDICSPNLVTYMYLKNSTFVQNTENPTQCSSANIQHAGFQFRIVSYSLQSKVTYMY